MADKEPQSKGDADEGKDIVAEAKKAFRYAEESEKDNRDAALDDVRFARLEEQWPQNIVTQRQKEGRPCLTISKMAAFIRQVVNDARQNKPSIKVHPVDSGADAETAKILDGLIRNIEYTSSADVAYDTATECAVTGGFGYLRVGTDYAHEDTFDMDLTIDRVSNPFSVYGDPRSTAADSSDWNSAFVVEVIPKDLFEDKYNDAEAIDWSNEVYKVNDPWFTEDSVMVAEWWTREEYQKQILQLSNGVVISQESFAAQRDLLTAMGITVVKQRTTLCYRTKQRTLTGADLIEERAWPGQYIPIIPVYGDEVDVQGKRYLRSLIRSAKDAQRMFNYWRTTTTELIALAPKTPFIGPKGAFKTDNAKWTTANTQSHSYIEFDGQAMPQRQPFVGVPAGALQEALNASDDMKAIMGLYDASLGARSNETSGRAILARQKEGDVSTFHFQDNMTRAIRHVGRILLDLIPFVYDKARILRVIGEDGTQSTAPINQPAPVMDQQGQPQVDAMGQAITRVYDLTKGKYDLTVSAGPSYTTRRQEAAAEMTEMVRSFPNAAPVIGDLIAKNLDWPGADEIAERLKAINPIFQKQGQGIPPEVQQQMQAGIQKIQELEQENAQLKAANELKAAELSLKQREADIKAFEAQTDQFRAETERAQPPPPPKPLAAAA